MTTGVKRRKDRPTPTQARAARRLRRNRRKRFLRTAGFSAIALVAFIFIVSLFAPSLNLSFGGGASGDAGERLPGVQGGTGNLHFAPGEALPTPYTSVPATSGFHYSQTGFAPARWGVHDQVLPDQVLVHNLEHAGVGIHYSCPEGCPELVGQLAGVVNRATKVIMSPYPELDTRITLTAWEYIDQFDQFDEARVLDFIRAHVNSSNAPEPRAP